MTADYTDKNERREVYQPGWWVLDVPTGKVGRVTRRVSIPHSLGAVYGVDFGTTVEYRNTDQLLLATRAQVPDAQDDV